MLMQRQYDKRGKITHVDIRHTGTSPEQNFSHRLVEQAIADGWMRLENDSLVIEATPENLTYRVKRTPGYWCKSTGELIPIGDLAWSRFRATGQGDISSREAKAWLASRGRKVDDYEVTWAYECVLDESQHDKFCATIDAKGRVVGTHRMEG